MKPTWLQQLQRDLPWFWAAFGISDFVFAALTESELRVRSGYVRRSRQGLRLGIEIMPIVGCVPLGFQALTPLASPKPVRSRDDRQPS